MCNAYQDVGLAPLSMPAFEELKLKNLINPSGATIYPNIGIFPEIAQQRRS